MYDISELLIISFILAFFVIFSIRKRKYKRKVDMVIKFNHDYSKIKNKNPMELQLNVGQFVVGTLGLVDHNTQQPVQATFSNPSNSSNDENVATVDSNNKVVGVGEGSTTVTFRSDVVYTDANTGQTVSTTKSVDVVVTVTLPPTPQEVDLVVTFSPAQPV